MPEKQRADSRSTAYGSVDLLRALLVCIGGFTEECFCQQMKKKLNISHIPPSYLVNPMGGLQSRLRGSMLRGHQITRTRVRLPPQLESTSSNQALLWPPLGFICVCVCVCAHMKVSVCARMCVCVCVDDRQHDRVVKIPIS